MPDKICNDDLRNNKALQNLTICILAGLSTMTEKTIWEKKIVVWGQNAALG